MFPNFFIYNPFCDGYIFVAALGVRVKMGLEDTIKIVEDLTRIHWEISHRKRLRILAWPSREKKENLVLFFNISIIFGPIIKYKKGPLGTGKSCIHKNIFCFEKNLALDFFFLWG
jgi:hypothetical protein